MRDLSAAQHTYSAWIFFFRGTSTLVIRSQFAGDCARSCDTRAGTKASQRGFMHRESSERQDFRLIDEPGQSAEFFFGHFRTAAQKRGHHLLRGSFKERFDHVSKRGLPHDMSRSNRKIDVKHSMLLVSQVPFLLKNPELGAHGGGMRIAGQFGDHFVAVARPRR